MRRIDREQADFQLSAGDPVQQRGVRQALRDRKRRLIVDRHHPDHLAVVQTYNVAALVLESVG